jgi:phosphoribosylformylglycinamidine cyclo-ligase
VLDLLRSGAAVHGLAHITGDGVLNLLRLGPEIGFEIDAPLPVPGVCDLVCELGGLGAAEAYRVFNMGCGLIAVVAPADADAAARVLAAHHPGARAIGRVTGAAGAVALPGVGVTVSP